MNTADNILLLQQAIGDGGIWQAKNRKDSDLCKLIYVLSTTHNAVITELNAKVKMLNIYNATMDNIQDWETYAGIPNSIFTKTTELELDKRIQQVLFQLVGFKNMTLVNLRNSLYNIFGVNKVNVKRGIDAVGFPYTFPITFVDQALVDDYVIVELPKNLKNQNVFPYTFPITFTTSQAVIIEQFIKAVVNFNIKIDFKYVL